MKRTLISFLALAGVWIAAGVASAQTATINFDVAGPADWNVDTNWITPEGFNFVPGDNFPDEIAGISNGGIVQLTSPADFDVAGLVIGETHDPAIPNPTEEDGTLNVSGAGQLRLVDPDGMGGAALRIGDGGRGVLNQSGGSISGDSVSVGGAADSTLNLTGSAILAVAAADLGRITRIEGPSVTLDVDGNLSVGGSFNSVITGLGHSAITVAGNASVGGTLRPEFVGGFTPSLGDSWVLINASSVSGVFAVDTTQTPSLPRGGAVTVTYDEGGSGDVVLGLSNRLILNVNRRTGAASIENAIGAPIEFDAYIIGSPSGVLDPGDGAWQSFEDSGEGEWDEARPTMNALSELNPIGSTTLDAGSVIGIGNPYAFQPTQLGESAEDLTFTYGTPSGSEITGIIEYTGPHNNMVLTVDPSTGEATIQNQSTFTADIDHYRISSESGSLLPNDGDWFSFSDAGLDAWDEARPTANNLSELNPTGSTVFGNGDSMAIGSPFDTGGVRDLAFEFGLVTGELIQGIVEYGELDDDGCIVGDTSPCDMVVDINDLNAVRNSFGTGDGTDTSGIPGDAFPFDGRVDINDLNGVRNTFGNTAAPVPEPTAWLLLSLGTVLLGAYRRR